MRLKELVYVAASTLALGCYTVNSYTPERTDLTNLMENSNAVNSLARTFLEEDLKVLGERAIAVYGPAKKIRIQIIPSSAYSALYRAAKSEDYSCFENFEVPGEILPSRSRMEFNRIRALLKSEKKDYILQYCIDFLETVLDSTGGRLDPEILPLEDLICMGHFHPVFSPPSKTDEANPLFGNVFAYENGRLYYFSKDYALDKLKFESKIKDNDLVLQLDLESAKLAAKGISFVFEPVGVCVGRGNPLSYLKMALDNPEAVNNQHKITEVFRYINQKLVNRIECLRYFANDKQQGFSETLARLGSSLLDLKGIAYEHNIDLGTDSGIAKTDANKRNPPEKQKPKPSLADKINEDNPGAPWKYFPCCLIGGIGVLAGLIGLISLIDAKNK